MPKHNKVFIESGRLYGKYLTLEEEVINTKHGNKDKRWKCLNIINQQYVYFRPLQLIKQKSLEDLEKEKSLENERLVKANSHQMGVRNRYFSEYKDNARKRNKEFNLSFEEFNNLITSNCFYCNSEPRKMERFRLIEHKQQPSLNMNGIDRIDSFKGYFKENCVTCCSTCNLMKNTMETDFFLNQVKKICKNLGSSTTISKESTL